MGTTPLHGTPSFELRFIAVSVRALVALVMAGGLLLSQYLRPAVPPAGRTPKPPFLPWQSIGGCGASSGSVSSGAQLKWIGRGVGGALVDATVLAGQSLDLDTALAQDESTDGRLKVRTTSVALEVGIHPRAMDIKTTLPVLAKEAYGSRTVGIGDLGLEARRRLGSRGQIGVALSASIPTGRYDIPNTLELPMVAELQLGSGLWGGGVSADYTMDWGMGMATVGGSFSAGLLSVQTTEYGFDTSDSRAVSVDRSLMSARDGWGARNDLGEVQPDNVGLFVDAGVKTRALVHGLGASLSLPLRDGASELREKLIDSDFGTDPSMPHYFASRAEAQRFADSRLDRDGLPQYEDPHVVGTDRRGRWVVMDHKTVRRPASPSLSLQYSVEKAHAVMPVLVGGGVRLEFDHGVSLGGVHFGVGVKYPFF